MTLKTTSRRGSSNSNSHGDRGYTNNDSQPSSFDKKQSFQSSTFTSSSSNDSMTTVDILREQNSNSFNEDSDDPLCFLFPDGKEDDDDDDVTDKCTTFSKKELNPLITVEHPTTDVTTKSRFAIALGNVSPTNTTDSTTSATTTDSKTQDYLDKRAMSPLQERVNAITILPNVFYCIYFVVAGCWLTADVIEMVRQSDVGSSGGEERDIVGGVMEGESEWTDMARNVFGDEGRAENTGCINIPMLPHFHALPPLPVLAGAIGIVAHGPFSFLYHWTYATKLHPAKRIDHWSRRLDHAFIHFASLCMSFATSGRLDYFLLCAAFNLDSAIRQFEPRVRPRRNQMRTTLSILLYILPVCRHNFEIFLQLVVIFGLCGWLFGAYPIGGWSHAMFHVVVAFMPHLIMISASQLPASQHQIVVAAQCAIMAGKA
mmetsp:Transcript_11097/g.24445  ORF Transcript_11097/g.24445 Transcript_11097/m.24445 type:complete len:429 (+) Transcript_11097:144-1430(+)